MLSIYVSGTYKDLVTLNEYQSASVGQAVAKSVKVTEGVTVSA